MPELLATQVGNNTIYIEAEPIYGSEQTTSLDETFERAGNALQHAKATITSIATSMVGTIADVKGVTKAEEFPFLTRRTGTCSVSTCIVSNT